MLILLLLITTGITAQVTDTIIVGEQGILIKGIKGDRGPMGPIGPKGDTDTVYSITRDTLYIIGITEPVDPTPTGNPASAFIDTMYITNVNETSIQVMVKTVDVSSAKVWWSLDGYEYPFENTSDTVGLDMTSKEHSLTAGPLNPGTTYHLRAYVTTKEGTTYGTSEVIATTKTNEVNLAENVTWNPFGAGGAIAYLRDGSMEITSTTANASQGMYSRVPVEVGVSYKATYDYRVSQHINSAQAARAWSGIENPFLHTFEEDGVWRTHTEIIKANSTRLTPRFYSTRYAASGANKIQIRNVSIVKM